MASRTRCSESFNFIASFIGSLIAPSDEPDELGPTVAVATSDGLVDILRNLASRFLKLHGDVFTTVNQFQKFLWKCLYHSFRLHY